MTWYTAKYGSEYKTNSEIHDIEFWGVLKETIMSPEVQ